MKDIPTHWHLERESTAPWGSCVASKRQLDRRAPKRGILHMHTCAHTHARTYRHNILSLDLMQPSVGHSCNQQL